MGHRPHREGFPGTDAFGDKRNDDLIRPVPLQNRVLPTGAIIADKSRGLFTGNRGILHRDDGTLGVARWRHKHWLVCALEHPRGIYHGPMPQRGWSALFFFDEAVALAAGHRPCHYCRRPAYHAFTEAWADAAGTTDRMTIDNALHKARVMRNRSQVRHIAKTEQLPDGTFVLLAERPALIVGDALLPFSLAGYEAPVRRMPGPITVLTPKPTVLVLRSGYAPSLHGSANL